MTTTTKNLKDIKVIIGVSDSISSDNLLTNIFDTLASSFKNFDSKSRLRLHPYFILSTVGNASKVTKELSVDDFKTLYLLQPALSNLHKTVMDSMANNELAKPEGRSILKTILSFTDSMQQKLNKISDNPIEAPV